MFYLFCFFFSVGCTFCITCLLACIRGHRDFVWYMIETFWLLAIGDIQIELTRTPTEEIIDNLFHEISEQLEEEFEKRKKEEDNS